jgi:hypothetical protein
VEGRTEHSLPGSGRASTGSRATNARYRLRYRFNCYQPYQDDTEIVIEGFGRSASSYAVVCLELAQDRPVRSAHHTHASAQVVKAARLGMPTIVIVKKPDDVAISHMVRHPGLNARTILDAWTRFHRGVAEVADDVIVISVEELDRDYGGVIERLNSKFDTTFTPPPKTEEFAKRVQEEMWQRHVDQGRPSLHFGRPTVERQAAKEALRHTLEAPELASIRSTAAELYASLVGSPP